jgi:hypothetical protein
MFANYARRNPLRAPWVAYTGLAAALRTPLWVGGARLKSVLESELDASEVHSVPDEALVLSLRISNGAIRHLSRTHTAWRNTCLYRSMAQYLVLKEHGRSAAIRIGVAPRNAHHDQIRMTAHSWVIHGGPEPVQDGGDLYQEMEFRRG